MAMIIADMLAPNKISPAYFLIVGNGRTGSSWLLTSLDQLPDVHARQELKWRTEFSTFRPDAHFAVGPAMPIAEAIDRVSSDPIVSVAIRGSKLIFDPYWYYGPRAFGELAAATAPDIGLILLKRDYLETWLSWKARGVYHEIDPSVGPIDPAINPMLFAMSTMARPETTSIVLHHNGAALSEEAGIAYPLETAIDDMFQMFSIDIQALTLLKERDGLVLNYREVERRLPEVASFIGSDADQEMLRKIAAKPQTIKLPTLSHLLHPSNVLASVANALDRTFEGAVSGISNPELNWRWIDDGHASLMAPAVVTALSNLGFQSPAMRSGGRSRSRWSWASLTTTLTSSWEIDAL